MREPRVDVTWSPERGERRELYVEYMASPEWFDRRDEWIAQWRTRTGVAPFCLVCLTAWHAESDDLHHVTYARLGRELFADLMALCRPCHRDLHHILEGNALWRQMGRRAATEKIAAMLRDRRAGA
jgi:5-methylcytosine-specific restriction endonuclease McrA